MTTTKVISGYYAGYAVPNGDNIYITQKGSIGGIGLFAQYNTTITNEGVVRADTVSGGVYFQAGGKLINGSATSSNALVQGQNYGVESRLGVATVVNFGVIEGESGFYAFGDGIDLLSGGVVINGRPIVVLPLYQEGAASTH
jgi:hypothetical protein